MAVLAGGSQGARIAWEQADDNVADRLLGLQAQIGLAEDLVPDQGVVTQSIILSEIAQLDVGVNVFTDGQTYGTNQLTSASNPFTAAMVGLRFSVQGFGERIITTFNGVGDIEFSGNPVPADTGRRFTQPLGIGAFGDGEISGTGNTLESVSAPFSAELVGRHVDIANIGSRLITAFTSATEIDFDGAAEALQIDLPFTIPVFQERAEHSIETAGGQIVDSHRVPAMNRAVTMRWRLGERRRRGQPRLAVPQILARAEMGVRPSIEPGYAWIYTHEATQAEAGAVTDNVDGTHNIADSVVTGTPGEGVAYYSFTHNRTTVAGDKFVLEWRMRVGADSGGVYNNSLRFGDGFFQLAVTMKAATAQFFNNNTGATIGPAAAIAAGFHAYRLVKTTVDGAGNGQVDLYIDGVLALSQAASAFFASASQNIAFGMRDENGTGDGDWDYFRLFV